MECILKNKRHETFCWLLAGGTLDVVEAFRKSGYKGGLGWLWRLLNREDVGRRLREIGGLLKRLLIAPAKPAVAPAMPEGANRRIAEKLRGSLPVSSIAGKIDSHRPGSTQPAAQNLPVPATAIHRIPAAPSTTERHIVEPVLPAGESHPLSGDAPCNRRHEKKMRRKAEEEARRQRAAQRRSTQVPRYADLISGLSINSLAVPRATISPVSST
jgi:hypothetical protein